LHADKSRADDKGRYAYPGIPVDAYASIKQLSKVI